MPTTINGRIDEDGAVITVKITDPSIAVADPFSPPPTLEPFVATALIDTGASFSALHPMVVAQLGLLSHGFASATSPGPQGPAIHQVPLHDVLLSIEGIPGAYWIQAVEAVPATESVLVLLGRDVLSRGTLVYDGPNRAFSLTF